MFGYAGKSEADLRELHSALKRACAHDPTLKSIAPNCSAHSHGWGCVIHADNGLFHYRSSTSIYEDDAPVPELKGDIRAIFHGRFASDPSLAGHIFCHPFVASTERELFFLAHNGNVLPDHLAARNVDSEWVLAQIIQAGSLAKALPKLRDRTESALNLLLLSLDRQSGAPATLHALNYYKPNEQPKIDYYQMFLGAMPGGRAFLSSTLKNDAGNIRGLTITGPAAFGEQFILAP